LSLDVDAPEQVAKVLRECAEIYYVSAQELEADWQDPGAGQPWTDAAEILEHAADTLEEKAKGWY
jgi:hypothetical protein